MAGARPPAPTLNAPGAVSPVDPADSLQGPLRQARGPWWPYVVLALLAGAVVLPGALRGQVQPVGDMLTQNLPLRILVGHLLARGRLPTFDPMIWSGSPLLAGFNAGAAFPAVALFALLSPLHALSAMVSLLFWVGASGAYALFRSAQARPVPALLGATTFAFSGAFVLQSVHMDMLSGLAILPWALLASRRMLERQSWWWAALTGGAVGLIVLGGSPEAMLYGGVVLFVHGALRCGLDRQRWSRFVSRGAAAVGLGLSLSALQWLPGLEFIGISQRASASASFVTTGSWPPKLAVLALVPFLFGGSRFVGVPSYFGPLNLPEMVPYVGVLPLVAVLSLLARRWRGRLADGERLCWYGVGLVSLVLAFGGYSPLEHLLLHVPLYGNQRLQARNLLGVDLAASALLALWLDGGRAPETSGARSLERASWLLPALGAIGLSAWYLLGARQMLADLGALPGSSPLGRLRTPLAVAVVLAVAAWGLASWRSRLRRTVWLAMAGLLIFVDVGQFVAFGPSVQSAPAPGLGGNALTPPEQLLARYTPRDGRYGVYDPQLYAYNSLLGAGDPDTGMYLGLASVQGYGSLADASYDAATRTHPQALLSPSYLQQGSFGPLDLDTMLTLPTFLLRPIAGMPGARGRTLPVSVSGNGIIFGGNSPGPEVPPPTFAGSRPPLAGHTSEGWWFGATLHPTAVDVLLAAPARASATVRLGALGRSGALSATATVTIPKGALVASVVMHGAPVAGLRVTNTTGTALALRTLAIADRSGDYLLQGALSNALRPGTWGYVHRAAGFSLFLRHRRAPTVWDVASVRGPGVSGAARNGAARLPSRPGPARLSVLRRDHGFPSALRVRSAVPTLVVRSVAWLPGWVATMRTGGGRQVTSAVQRVGLVQGVSVPAGTTVVRFEYRAPGLRAAGALTLGALALLCVAGLASALPDDRGRHGRSHHGRGGGPSRRSVRRRAGRGRMRRSREAAPQRLAPVRRLASR